MIPAILMLGSCTSGQVQKYLPDGTVSAGENTRVNTIYGTVEGYLDGDTQSDYGFGNQFYLEPMDEACQVLSPTAQRTASP